MDLDEKQQHDSMATVTIKEYPPSESYSSEPPPVGIYEAYQKPKSSAVQIARIAAFTVVACTVILGSFILAAAWLTATTSCQNAPLPQEADRPSFQHLVDPLQSEESKTEAKEEDPADDEEDNDISSNFQFKLPLTLDFDELAGSLIEKNQKSRMNCVVEKRRAEEVVDHQAKTVRLPFGVNLTTDPRFEHISGEKMMIFCESGNEQRHTPMESMPTVQVVPLPGPVHLPLHFNGPMQQPKSANPLPNMQLLHHILQQHQQQEQQEQREQHQNQQREQQMPTVIHTTIHVGEERPVPMEGRQGRAFLHPVPLPVQVNEERPDNRQGRAFLRPVQIPFEVAEEARRGRAFAVPVALPIQVSEERNEGRQGRGFAPPQVEVTEARVFTHPVEAAEARAFHAQLSPEMGRSFPRLPVHAPAPQEAESQHMEQPRPHYVQPRSVRSVDDVLHREKRVKRCACNCAC